MNDEEDLVGINATLFSIIVPLLPSSVYDWYNNYHNSLPHSDPDSSCYLNIQYISGTSSKQQQK